MVITTLLNHYLARNALYVRYTTNALTPSHQAIILAHKTFPFIVLQADNAHIHVRHRQTNRSGAVFAVNWIDVTGGRHFAHAIAFQKFATTEAFKLAFGRRGQGGRSADTDANGIEGNFA